MARLIPGYGYTSGTGLGQYLVPGTGYISVVTSGPPAAASALVTEAADSANVLSKLSIAATSSMTNAGDTVIASCVSSVTATTTSVEIEDVAASILEVQVTLDIISNDWADTVSSLSDSVLPGYATTSVYDAEDIVSSNALSNIAAQVSAAEAGDSIDNTTFVGVCVASDLTEFSDNLEGFVGISDPVAHYTGRGDKFSVHLAVSPYEVKVSNMPFTITFKQ